MARGRWRVGWILACLLAAAAPVTAAEDANPADAPVGWLFRWLHFLLVFGGGGYLLAKKTPAIFRRRADKIAAGITDAARARAAAEARLREAEEKLAGLGQESDGLRDAARRDSAAECERIRQLARQEAEKIERAAQAEIEAAERAALTELKASAARLAVARAQAMLREQLSAQAEAGLFHSFVASLARGVH